MTANRANAALMVRLHCDADADTGFAVYAPDRAGHVGAMRGPSAQVIAESESAARAFHAALARDLAGALRDRGLHPDTGTRVGGAQGALTGSIYSHVPVLLVEMCVLTNPRDEAFIASPSGQKRMADALADGVAAALQH
jgi:N-acetylmuramoyl-L-alanine amidase